MSSYVKVVFIGIIVSVLTAWIVCRCLSKGDVSPHVSLKGLWRPVWPFISMLSVWCEPLLSWSQRSYLAKKAYQAALPAFVNPAHMVACWLWMIIVGAVLGTCLWQLLAIKNALFWGSFIGGIVVGVLTLSMLVSRVNRYQRAIDRELPFVLDMMTLCVESGLSLQRALQQVDQYAPAGVLVQEIRHLLSDLRSGHSKAKAFKALAQRCESPSVKAWVSVMLQSDQLGMCVGLILREAANQSRLERIQRAEKSAMEAPVKMLLPLIGCIFPCTFIVLAFPIVVHMWRGMP